MNSKRLHSMVLVLVMAGFASAAQAELSYDYVQAAWIVDGDIDVGQRGTTAFSEDYDGFAVEGSALVGRNIFVTGQATFAEFNGAPSISRGIDTSLDQLSLGVGGRLPLVTGATALDVYGVASYERVDLFGGAGDGWGATVGVRWQPMPRMEVNPSVGYVDYGEMEIPLAPGGIEVDGWHYGIRAVYAVTEQFSAVLDYRSQKLDLDSTRFSGSVNVDLENEIRIGARLNFE